MFEIYGGYMKNIRNFRDLGGILAADGKAIRKGLLLRCSQPSDLDADEIKALAMLNILHIVDLRRPWESKIAPVCDLDGALYTNIDVMADKAHVESSFEEWISNTNLETVEQGMFDTYTCLVSTTAAHKGFAQFLRICLDADGAVLFHCHAGKDRTGVAAAILLKILGASDEDIFTDYMETMTDVNYRLPNTLEEYRTKGLDETKLEAIAIVYSIKREYLQAAFTEIDEAFGGFENYVEQELGVTQEEISRLKEKYLLGYNGGNPN